MALEQDIDKFCGYFEEQAQQINTIQSAGNSDYGGSQIRLYKKTLYVTALDTLAGFRFNKDAYKELHRQNKKRFIRFLQDFCNWSNGGLVSLPFLFDQLSTSRLKDSRLFASVEDKIRVFSGEDGGTLNIEDMDLSLNVA